MKNIKTLISGGILAAGLLGIIGCADDDDYNHHHHRRVEATVEETHERGPVQQTTTVETERRAY